MEKSDLAKKYKTYYTAKPAPALVEIEKAQFLSIKGKGDPAAKEFADRIQALYTTAYTVKFICKTRHQDFTVPKLEGLWWFDEGKYGHVGMTDAPVAIPRSEWEYRMLIRMPDFVTHEDIKTAIKAAYIKKQLPLVAEIEPYEMTEGKAVQMLHTGPFDKEPDTLRQMNDFIQQNNFQKNGLHHEIYLSDFRKTAPEKLKTILREPVI